MIVLLGCEIQKDIVEPIEQEPITEPESTPPVEKWFLYKDQFNAWSCNDKTQTTDFELIDTFSSEEECVNFCLSVPRPESSDCEQRNAKIQCLKQPDKIFLKGFGGTCIDKKNNDDCIDAGGLGIKWFSNGCVDNCGTKPRICTQAFKLGCDCGTTMCYDGQQCVNDKFEPYATKQEACEKTGGNWTQLKCPLPICTNGICKEVVCPPEEIRGEICVCPKEEIFTLQGCTKERELDLLSTIAYK